MPMLRIALLPPAMLAIAAPALPHAADSPQSRRACFWPSQVSGFGDAGPDKAILRIGARERWELTLSPGCPDVDWAMRIGIRARGGERVCEGRPAELIVPEESGTGARRCLVRTVRKLPAEAG
jgi:hypothetical protein